MRTTSLPLQSLLLLGVAVVIAVGAVLTSRQKSMVPEITGQHLESIDEVEKQLSYHLQRLQQALKGQLTRTNRILAATSQSKQVSSEEIFVVKRIVALQHVHFFQQNDQQEWEPIKLLSSSPQNATPVDSYSLQNHLTRQTDTDLWQVTEEHLYRFIYWADDSDGRKNVAIYQLERDELTQYISSILSSDFESHIEQLSQHFKEIQINELEDQYHSNDSLTQPAHYSKKINSQIGSRELVVWFLTTERISYHYLTLGLGLTLSSILLTFSYLRFRLFRMRQQTSLEKADLLMRISHDLRTPLTGLTLGLDIAESDLLHDQPLQASQRIGSLKSETERMNLLLNNALDFSRGVREEAPIECIPQASIQTLLDNCQLSLAASGVQLETHGINNLAGTWKIHLQSLERILLNLLENIRRHASSGEWASVSFSHQQVDQLSVRVEDRGPGISSSSIPTSLNHDKGAGLGLSISKQLARQAGGELRHIKTDQGACFVFTISCTPVRKS